MTTDMLRHAASIAVVVTLALLLRWASFVQLPHPERDEARVRLSWSARPERIEQCRRRADEELAALPEHMRLRLDCTGTFARYLLQLSVDDTPAWSDTARGGGFRRDRPLHVLRDVSLRPGTRRIRVLLTRVDTVALPATPAPDKSDDADVLLAEGRESRERDERARLAGGSIPPRLELDTTITLLAGRVLLVTYDDVRRTLVTRVANE